MLDTAATPETSPHIDASSISMDRLETAIDGAARKLLDRQTADGHWAFALEADATIPAEYIMLNHYLGDIDDEVERKLANYLRDIQNNDGSWPLFHGGEINVSASVKAYFALKLVGDDPAAPHMQKAREIILAHGGAARCNVFTRFSLALFEQIPWRATPVSRVEALLFPRWFPFHIEKVSYWSRTVMVPLLVLAALRPKAANPRAIRIDELFVNDPMHDDYRLENPTGSWLGSLLLALDKIAQPLQSLIPSSLTRIAIDRAMNFIDERLNGEDGLGGIFPAMANALMAYRALGVDKDDQRVIATRKAIDDLLVVDGDTGFCQPCVSPVWDTGLAMHALLEAGAESEDGRLSQAGTWLEDRQILDTVGDWAWCRKNVRPGGWAFQYNNDHYPDVDDSAVVIMALHRLSGGGSTHAIDRGAKWICGMQSSNGGWGAFDADNEYYFLNNVPFADHGALLDPPTADVTARCIGMLGQLGGNIDDPRISKAVHFLKKEQEADGSWFGRWGTNYIYGTWSVLSALNAVNEDMESDYVRRAVTWLKSEQRPDGGWGEDCQSYWPNGRHEMNISLPSQTAWAVLAMIAAGEVESDAVRRGIEFLLDSIDGDGEWHEKHYNAVGFPRVFYLLYHGYRAYFPLWALARYRNLVRGNMPRPQYGI